MKVAITVWGNRISPVFDSAQTLLITEISKSKIVDRQIEKIQAGLVCRMIDLLEKLRVEVLICGALSAWPAVLFETHGIELVPFIAGDAEMVLSLYAEGKDLAEFIMPGCPRHRCCRGRRCAPGHQRIR
jgi:predicted Fe-Mo cluster-binding NifX family protein